MHQRITPEASEDRFRKFSAELLAAEEVGFRGGFFYSPEALRNILECFCNIIVEKLHVQSCTVQLKLYDSLNSPVLKRLLDTDGELPHSSEIKELNNCSGDLQTLWDNFADKCQKRYEEVVTNNKKAGDKQIEFRRMLLKNSIIFPYALYPKGALWLVASNEKGPWAKCAPWLITDINRGIMTQIIQDKAARVRDRMSLRQTRAHRKLGLMDPHIWTNQLCASEEDDQPSPLYFFNYYGVPILIHQGGDVIGILRVENKGLRAVKKTSLNEPKAVVQRVLKNVLAIPLDTKVPKFAETLHKNFLSYKKEIATNKELEPGDVSLLSLVYLAHDLADAKRPSDKTVRDLCTLPFPHRKGQPNDERPAHDERPPEKKDVRPPVQITFDNSEEERAFVDWLSGTQKELSKTQKENEKSRFEAVQKFYATLNSEFSTALRDNVNGRIETALCEAIKEASKAAGSSTLNITFKDAEPRSLLRTVQLDIPDDKKRFLFHVQVTPMQCELATATLMTVWGLSKKSADQYCQVNRHAVTRSSDDWEFHLPTDRLAARIDALTFAFPIPRFSIDDAWWLSWAALEIGKLIERQISYRGTNLSPTVPLTAMDFFRVPISDLGFVDALRSQYKAAQTVKGMLEYHIPNNCRELSLEVTLEHSSRIKDFRSYLERLGQEHRAHYDALIATWLHVLCLSIDPAETRRLLSEAKADHRAKCDENYLREGLEEHFSNLSHCEALYEQVTALLTYLESFDKTLKGVCDKSELLTDENAKWLKKSGKKVFGDLKFAAPQIDLEEKDRLRARALILRNLRSSPQAAATISTGDHDKQMDEQEILEYVLRRYDPFVTYGISLYILLTNTIDNNKAGKEYKDFYDKCRNLTGCLRKKFEASYQLNEQWRDAPGSVSATKSLIDELGRLRAKIFELSTTDFSSVIKTAKIDVPGPREKVSENDAYLSVKGIYKRIRTLMNIAGNQVCPPLLNWETSRFDYVGARINCLFKNQVFAIYEHLWNRGDPFSHWTIDEDEDDDGSRQTDAGKRASPKGGCPSSKDESSRQRWLSIQTKIHRGKDGYNAWQMSALMDPRAAFKGYWASSLYTIRALRTYLVLAFDKWHEDLATEYRQRAHDRSRLQEEYCQWFSRGYITHVLRQDPAAAEKEVDQEIYFPEYLLRTPLDIFIRLLETDLVRKRDFQQILNSLIDFVKNCLRTDNHEELWTDAQQIYSKAKELAERKYSDIDRKDEQRRLEYLEVESALKGQLLVLKKEESRFAKLAKWPDRTAFKNEPLAARLKTMRTILNSNETPTEIWRKGLRHLLIELQSTQKQYLFELKNLRDPENVLDRILCYVLLFDPKLGDEKCKDTFKNWSAYDLFYYLTSLVPVEMQVRTALADTMAEQYHGVYKSNVNPAQSVAVQRRRLQEMGRKLDELDCETEAIYDGYIVHSVLHAKSLKSKRDDENNE